jgi:drug/metabolite transporter (DMT)-like permease
MDVVWGLSAAILWGLAALVMTRPARLLGARTTLGWTMAFGALVTTPLALAVSGVPDAPPEDWAWAALAGLGFVVGSGCWLLGVRLGDVSVVTPIVATDGALAAVIAIATGEELGAVVVLGIGIVACGVVLVSLQRRGVHRSTPPLAIAVALSAAACFAVVFTASGRIGALGAMWATAVTRIVGATVALPPELLRRRIPPRDALPWLAGSAILDSAGFAALVQGAGDGVAVAAVLASQYAVVTVIGGVLVYHERLAPWQFAGIALTAGGVATLALARTT